MSKIRIATWNINSIRIRLELLAEVIRNNNIDIILLQETKCQDREFPVSAMTSMKMNSTFVGQKSYNGVAILSKHPLDVVTKELPLYYFEKEDEEARYVEAMVTFEKKIIRVASVYVPMGGSTLEAGEKLEDSKRFRYKLNFYKRLQARILELKQETNDFQDEYIVFGGDLNVAQEEIDLSHPKENDGGVGFHPLEREALREIRKCGLEDSFRAKFPTAKQYTWWDYRTRAFSRNIGWRLDYLLSSPNVLSGMKECFVDMKTRAKEKTSDHAPSIIEFEV